MPLSMSAADYTRQVRMRKDRLFLLQPTKDVVTPLQSTYTTGMGLYKTAGKSIIQKPASQFCASLAGCRVCTDVHKLKTPPEVRYYPA
jgi:hypothetical protein